MRYTRVVGAIVIASLLAACGGGGGGGSTSALPSAPNQPVNTPSYTTGKIQVALTIPPQAKQSAKAIQYLQSHSRTPKYLSGSTTELDFTLNTVSGTAVPPSITQFNFSIFTSNSSQCTGNNTNGYQCSATVPAPVGTDVYVVKAYQCSVAGSGPSASCASLGGTLTVLSETYVTVHVALDVTVVAAFTLSPVIASIDWAPVSYATVRGPSPMNPALWLTKPNGPAIPNYQPSPQPGSYSCTQNVGSGTGNGCYEPVAQGVSIAYGEQLEARDPNGALIIGASNGSVYQTPLYLDATGHAVTISWSCTDATGGTSLKWETGGGPFSGNASATPANQSFNSPVANPSQDPDGGNTVDGNGNPVTAVGNNGLEMSWDGVDQPLFGSPDSCSASTSNGLMTSANFYVGLGEGGVQVNPGVAPDGTLWEQDQNVALIGNNQIQPIFAFQPGAYTSAPTEIDADQGVGYASSPSAPTGPGLCPFGIAAQGYCSGDNLYNGLAFDTAGNLWVNGLMSPNGEVASFNGLPTPSSSLGNWLMAQQTINTSNWAFGGNGLAIDANNNIYTTSGFITSTGMWGVPPGPQFPIAIAGFARGSSNMAAPTTLITGSSTGLHNPQRIRFDASGNLWVLNQVNWNGGNIIGSDVLDFAPGANGNVAPAQSLLDEHWSLNCNVFVSSVSDFTFDPQGNLLVLANYMQLLPGATAPQARHPQARPGNPGSPFGPEQVAILIFPPGFNDSTCPIANLGLGTQNPGVKSLAVDDVGYAYVGFNNNQIEIVSESASNGSNGQVTPYATFSGGVVPPSATVVFGSSGDQPAALAVSTASGWRSGDARRSSLTTRRKP